MSEWVNVYADTNQRIDKRDTGTTDADGGPVWEERITYANGNEDTIRKAARTALDTNKTFLALAAPTNAQSLAQIRALTRQVNALIRMELDDYSADA